MNFLLQFAESKVESPFHARRASTIPTLKSTTWGKDCTQHAQPGMSIGIPNSSAGSSTLGRSSWPSISRRPGMASLRLNLLSCSLSARGPPKRFEYNSRGPRRYRKVLPTTRYWVHPRYWSEKKKKKKTYIYALTNGHLGIIDEMVIYVRNVSDKGSLGQTQVRTSVKSQCFLTSHPVTMDDQMARKFEPGDSSSFVFDRYGCVMGMVLGGSNEKTPCISPT